MFLLLSFFACQTTSPCEDTSVVPTDSVIDETNSSDAYLPSIILEWTDTQLIVSLTGSDVPYWFGLASLADDSDVITWTGEDCYRGWYNELNDETIRHCHSLHTGINIFETGAYTQGLDPNTETWFGVGDYLNPSIELSYSVWLNPETCWAWGGTYYTDVCETGTINTPFVQHYFLQ